MGMAVTTLSRRTRKFSIDAQCRAGLALDANRLAQVGTLSFVRYSLIGGVATFVHWLVLVALVEGTGMNPGPSAAIGAMCGALTGYAGNRRFTFSSHAPHRQALPRFLVIAAGAAIANGAVVWTGTESLHFHYLVPQAAATALTLVAGFALNRSWTFS